MDLPHLRSIGLPVVAASGMVPGFAGITSGGACSSETAPPPRAPTTVQKIPAQFPCGKKQVAVVEHLKALPRELCNTIPNSDARILTFLLHFLKAQDLGDVPIFINGGYVRDLLLGKTPDDLDLSLCLRDCPEGITVSSLLQRLPAFIAVSPALGVTEVKVATILSNESKDKQLDTFKAYFIDVDGGKTEVDVMPTIGEEVYEESSRVPIRDQRGNPEDDALRRDLTIGALLLRVTLEQASNGLEYELLDFYGGVDDLNLGVLRSPYPKDKSYNEVRELVLRTESEERLAEDLGLGDLSEQQGVQVLWWVKVLMDDPVRICRALRFAAKFKFRLHDSFWQSVPFAIEALKSKVAGSRKNTEYQKLAGYGYESCVGFFELAFGRTFGTGKQLRLAAALFGGQDAKGHPKSISEVSDFDTKSFRQVCECYRVVHDDAELSGALMGAALAIATSEAGAKSPKDQFSLACDGMCVSNAMREAGTRVLSAAERLAAPLSAPNGLHRGFARACGLSVEELLLHGQVWDAFALCQPRAGPAGVCGPRRQLAVALLPWFNPSDGQVEQVNAVTSALAFERPVIRGTVLSCKGVLEVPNELKSQVMLLLDVALRVLKISSLLENEEHLVELLKSNPNLRDALDYASWYKEDGRTLREEFAPAKKGRK